VVKDSPLPPASGRKAGAIFLAGVALIAVALALYLQGALSGPAMVHIGGAVEAPYEYPLEHGDIAQVTAEGTLRDVTSRYTGVPVRELMARARPRSGASLLLIHASDGYAFFISVDEVRDNGALLLAVEGEGSDASYNLVGASNSKAWVRGVSELTVVGSAMLEVSGLLAQPAPYDPDDWQTEMDSTRLDLGNGPQKVQGISLGKVLRSMQPGADATTVLLHSAGEAVSLAISEVLSDDDIRIFTVIGQTEVTFAVAHMSGHVLAAEVARLEVR